MPPITAETTFARLQSILEATHEEEDEYFPYVDDDDKLVGAPAHGQKWPPPP